MPDEDTPVPGTSARLDLNGELEPASASVSAKATSAGAATSSARPAVRRDDGGASLNDRTRPRIPPRSRIVSPATDPPSTCAIDL